MIKSPITYLTICFLFLVSSFETFIVWQQHKEIRTLKQTHQQMHSKGSELYTHYLTLKEENEKLFSQHSRCETFIFNRGLWFLYGYNPHPLDEEPINGKSAV